MHVRLSYYTLVTNKKGWEVVVPVASLLGVGRGLLSTFAVFLGGDVGGVAAGSRKKLLSGVDLDRWQRDLNGLLPH